MPDIATLRNADLATLGDLLAMQSLTKRDAVVDASTISMDIDGRVHVEGLTDGTPMRCTDVFDEGLADKLKIPLKYVREMRKSRPDILAANVNGWLTGDPAGAYLNSEGAQYSIDDRKFMVRSFSGADDTMPGIARAFLSDTYKRIDNWDAVVAVLEGIRAAGVDAIVDRCQLTERRMSFTVVCPQLGLNVANLMEKYRSPFDEDSARGGGWQAKMSEIAKHVREGTEGGKQMMWAGFDATNSETGSGAFVLTPRVVFAVCTNGLKIPRDAARRVHLGEKLDTGIYAQDTMEKNVELIKLMTRDSVAAWLSMDYLEGIAAELAAGEKEISDPAKSIKILAQQQAYTDETAAGILNHFIKGGQMSVLGLMNAVTSYAQVTEDADVAYDLENSAFSILEGSYV